jgi:hypothetical protein
VLPWLLSLRHQWVSKTLDEGLERFTSALGGLLLNARCERVREEQGNTWPGSAARHRD